MATFPVEKSLGWRPCTVALDVLEYNRVPGASVGRTPKDRRLATPAHSDRAAARVGWEVVAW